ELLFMGGMDWYPNRDAMSWFLDEIWPVLSQAVPSLRVTVVGRSEGMAARADERVLFTGVVPDVRPYLHRAVAFIFPMTEGCGTRLKIVEALAAGLPVISTRLGWEGLAVRDREEVLFAERPEEWIEAVNRLLSDHATWRRLSEQGRMLIDRQYSVPV